jgi:hypothetical protein
VVHHRSPDRVDNDGDLLFTGRVFALLMDTKLVTLPSGEAKVFFDDIEVLSARVWVLEKEQDRLQQEFEERLAELEKSVDVIQRWWGDSK